MFPLELRIRFLNPIHIPIILIRNFLFFIILLIFYKFEMRMLSYTLLFLNSLLLYYFALSAIRISSVASLFTSLLGSLEMVVAIVLINKSNNNILRLVILGSLIYFLLAIVEVVVYNFISSNLLLTHIIQVYYYLLIKPESLNSSLCNEIFTAYILPCRLLNLDEFKELIKHNISNKLIFVE